MAVTTFEDLEVWKRGCQLAVDLCVAIHDSKDYALKNQMERAAISIPSNIAEGAEREVSPEGFEEDTFAEWAEALGNDMQPGTEEQAAGPGDLGTGAETATATASTAADDASTMWPILVVLAIIAAIVAAGTAVLRRRS